MELFTTCSHCFEIGDFEKGEQKQIALCYIFFRESVVAHPRIRNLRSLISFANNLGLLIFAENV